MSPYFGMNALGFLICIEQAALPPLFQFHITQLVNHIIFIQLILLWILYISRNALCSHSPAQHEFRVQARTISTTQLHGKVAERSKAPGSGPT